MSSRNLELKERKRDSAIKENETLRAIVKRIDRGKEVSDCRMRVQRMVENVND